MHRLVVLALVVSVAANLLGASLWANRREPRTNDEVAHFEEALDLVQKNLHGKGLTRRQLIEAAIDGMLLRVDPDGAYLDHDDLEFYNQTMTVKRGYVGISVRFERHLVVVGSRMGSSAFQAGIRPGDHILEIDGVPVSELSVEKATQSLVGKPKTRVSLKVLSRSDREPSMMELTRDG
jgi:carboxyl-terminal processing protease